MFVRRLCQQLIKSQLYIKIIYDIIISNYFTLQTRKI